MGGLLGALDEAVQEDIGEWVMISLLFGAGALTSYFYGRYHRPSIVPNGIVKGRPIASPELAGYAEREAMHERMVKLMDFEPERFREPRTNADDKRVVVIITVGLVIATAAYTVVWSAG